MAPSFIVLAHELIHALHRVTGTRHSQDEAARSTGIGPYADEELTESAIRTEFGLPRRNTYWNARWLGAFKAGPAPGHGDRLPAQFPCILRPRHRNYSQPTRSTPMAKGQQKSNREAKKPKASKTAAKTKAAAASTTPPPRPEPGKK